jgi:hypothetical protein
LVLLLTACITSGTSKISEGGGGGTGPSAPVASVAVTPAVDTTVPAGSVHLTAELKDASGNPVSGAAVSWTSSSSAIATVSNLGDVSGLAAGVATITATSGGKSGGATVVVRDGGPATPAGGTVDGLNGNVVLIVPAGALFQNTNIFIEPPTGLPAEPRLVAGTAVVLGPPGLGFAMPVTLTIKYTDAGLGGASPDSLTVNTYQNGFWASAGTTTVNKTAHTVSVQLPHLSTYGVLKGAGVASVEVDSRSLRAAITSAGVCVNQFFAVVTAPLDASGNLLPNPVTAVSGNTTVATVTQLTRDSTQFFFRGKAAGTATVTFTSGSAAQPIAVTVTACSKPTILAGSNKSGNFELYRYLSGVSTDLTNNPAIDQLGRVSPDGSTIGFESDRAAVGGDLKLYLMNADGTNARPLLNAQGYQRDLAWAPDGTWIAGRGPKSNGNPGIYRVNVDGSGATLLTPGGSTGEAFPAISPDGQWIAFSQRDLSGPTPGPYHLKVMHADGTGVRDLLFPFNVDGGGADDVTPSFAPNHPLNPEIVFIRNFPNASGSWVVRVRLNGNGFFVLTGGGFDYFPSFCQDGEHVLFTHSNAFGVGPYAVVVQDAWLQGSDGGQTLPPGLADYGQLSYYPRPAGQSLPFGCIP